MEDRRQGLTRDEFYAKYPEKRIRNSRNSGQEQPTADTELNINDTPRRANGINTSSTQDLSRVVTPEAERSRNNQGQRPAPTPVPGLPSPSEELPGGLISGKNARVYGAPPRPPQDDGQKRQFPPNPPSKRGIARLVSGETDSIPLSDYRIARDLGPGDGSWRATADFDQQRLAERASTVQNIYPGSADQQRRRAAPQRRNVNERGAEVITGKDVGRMYAAAMDLERKATGEPLERQQRPLFQGKALSLAAQNLQQTARDPGAGPVTLGVARQILLDVASRATGEGLRTPLALKDAVEASQEVRGRRPRRDPTGDPSDLDLNEKPSPELPPYGATELPFVDSKGRITPGRVYAGDPIGTITVDPDNTASFKQNKDVSWGNVVAGVADATKTQLIVAPNLRQAYRQGQYRLASEEEKAGAAGKSERNTLHGYLQQGSQSIPVYGPFGKTLVNELIEGPDGKPLVAPVEQDYYRIGNPFSRDSDAFRDKLIHGDRELLDEARAAGDTSVNIFPAPVGGFQSKAALQSPRALAQLANSSGLALEAELPDGRTVAISPGDMELYAGRIAAGIDSGEWSVGADRVVQGGALPRFYLRGESGRQLLVPVRAPSDQYPVLFKTAIPESKTYAGPAFLHPDLNVRLRAEEWAAQQPGMPVSLPQIIGELTKAGRTGDAPIVNSLDAAFRIRAAVVQRMQEAGMSDAEMSAVLAGMNRTPAESRLARQSAIARLGIGRELDVQALGAPTLGIQVGPVASGDTYADNLITSSVRGVGPVASSEMYAQLSDPNFARRLEGVQGIGPVASSALYSRLMGRADQAGSTMQPDLPGDAIAQQLMEDAAEQEARLRAVNPTGYGYAAFGNDYRPYADELDDGLASDLMPDDTDLRGATPGGRIAAATRAAGVEDYLARVAMARLAHPSLLGDGPTKEDLSRQAALFADVANRSGQSLEQKIAAVYELTGGEPRSAVSGTRQLVMEGGTPALAYSRNLVGPPIASLMRRPSGAAPSSPTDRVLDPASYRQTRLPLPQDAISNRPGFMGWDQPAAQREAAIRADLAARRLAASRPAMTQPFIPGLQGVRIGSAAAVGRPDGTLAAPQPRNTAEQLRIPGLWGRPAASAAEAEDTVWLRPIAPGETGAASGRGSRGQSAAQTRFTSAPGPAWAPVIEAGRLEAEARRMESLRQRADALKRLYGRF